MSESNEVLVEVEGLTKHYGSIRAVDGISFSVARGDVLGFLGPNGAGKTTAMKMIMGFLEPDAGSVVVAGHDVATSSIEARRRIGYLPENAPAYGEMDVVAFLEFVAEARQLSDPQGAIDRVIGLTRLQKVTGQTIETLSKGFKRRVGLAQALIHDPEVLILDEPTDGLDPNQKAVVQELIAGLALERAIILSTHILDEAEKVCNRAVILSSGQILVDSTPEELMNQASAHNAVDFAVDAAAAAELASRCNEAPWCAAAQDLGEGWVRVRTEDGRKPIQEFYALAGSDAVRDVRVVEGRLDDLFREITKGVAA